MLHITVIGGTGYAGSAIVAEAVGRGHHVRSFSRSLPTDRLDGVKYLIGEATDESVVGSVISGADVIVGALSPRGSLTASFREVNDTIARLADDAHARLFVVGGFSSLRPAPGAPRFVSDMSHVPAEAHAEVLAGAALITEDLPAAPLTLDWVFVSPAMHFGAFAPGETRGEYRLGDEVAVDPDGGDISAADYALGFVDLIERDDHHRVQVNLAH